MRPTEVDNIAGGGGLGQVLSPYLRAFRCPQTPSTRTFRRPGPRGRDGL